MDEHIFSNMSCYQIRRGQARLVLTHGIFGLHRAALTLDRLQGSFQILLGGNLHITEAMTFYLGSGSSNGMSVVLTCVDNTVASPNGPLPPE